MGDFSGLYNIEKNFEEILGGIQRDSYGNIIGAKAVLHNFFGKMNTTQALTDIHSITDAVGVYVDLNSVNIEQALVDTVGGTVNYPSGMIHYMAVESSFNKIASATIFSDISTVVMGFCIVLIYVVCMLGKFHKVENRVRAIISTIYNTVFLMVLPCPRSTSPPSALDLFTLPFSPATP